MQRWSFFIGLTCLCGLIATIGLAGETSGKKAAPGGPQVCCLPPPISCCPDDYCRKPLPWLPCLTWCRTCDDYCRKPPPCVPCLPTCRTCDDYCRKPFPQLCWTPACNFVCVPSCGVCPSCASQKGKLALPRGDRDAKAAVTNDPLPAGTGRQR